MLIVLSRSDTLPVTLPLAKDQSRIDSNDEDVLSLQHLKAAIDYCERYTQRFLRQATVEFRVESWDAIVQYPYAIEIPAVPIRAVDSIVYIDEDGNEQEIDAADYRVENTESGATVIFGPDYLYPSLYRHTKYPVRLVLDVGYDDPSETGSGLDPMLQIPEALQQAILMTYAHWHEVREASATVQITEAPLAATALLNQLRIHR